LYKNKTKRWSPAASESQVVLNGKRSSLKFTDVNPHKRDWNINIYCKTVSGQKVRLFVTLVLNSKGKKITLSSTENECFWEIAYRINIWLFIRTTNMYCRSAMSEAFSSIL
jgi:hypothetical protein